jgi:toxin HigB-1
MIRSFKHKGLARYFNGADASGLAPELVTRIGVRLRALHAATKPEDLNIPGFDFHTLKGKPKRYTVHVNGPFCLTFEWEDGAAWRVHLENYH